MLEIFTFLSGLFCLETWISPSAEISAQQQKVPDVVKKTSKHFKRSLQSKDTTQLALTLASCFEAYSEEVKVKFP